MISAAAPPTYVPRDIDRECGGARVLDLAICMILSVTVVGLLMLAL